MRDYEEKSYYEIQLDNKQLILVFLGGVTVCVLVFVLGVMVGKGKKEAEMAALTPTEQSTTTARPQPDASQPKEVQPVADEGAPRERNRKNKKDRAEEEAAKEPPAAPVPKADKMTYGDLDKTDTEAPLTPQPEPAGPAPKQAQQGSTPSPATALSDVASKTQEPSASNGSEKTPSTGMRYTVQVMATGSKEKADEQLNFLKSKGYTAFMNEEKTASGSSVYKVRVGKFGDSDSAKKIAIRLKQDLKLETWVAVLEQ